MQFVSRLRFKINVFSYILVSVSGLRKTDTYIMGFLYVPWLLQIAGYRKIKGDETKITKIFLIVFKRNHPSILPFLKSAFITNLEPHIHTHIQLQNVTWIEYICVLSPWILYKFLANIRFVVCLFFSSRILLLCCTVFSFEHLYFFSSSNFQLRIFTKTVWNVNIIMMTVIISLAMKLHLPVSCSIFSICNK